MYPDFADVKGQQQVKRALEVAAAGLHSVLLIGPPGAGKSMLAARFPGLLPPMTEDEALETAAVQSLAGSFSIERWRRRPFRSPHHTSSGVALVGGGAVPRPGEISLAHHGVLFLDELPEFDRKVLEVLREPLESGEITISRAARQADFPARFQLIAAMNPCPCGWLGHPSGKCRCTPDAVLRYQDRISGPLLDRIDLQVPVAAMAPETMAAAGRRRTEQRDRRARHARARAPAGAPGQGQPQAGHARDRPPLPARRRRRPPAARRDAAPALVGARLPPRAEGGAHDRRPGRCRHACRPQHVAEAIQYRRGLAER